MTGEAAGGALPARREDRRHLQPGTGRLLRAVRADGPVHAAGALVGIVYIFFFEGLLAIYDTIARRMTVMYYFRVLVLSLARPLSGGEWNFDLDRAPSSAACVAILLGAGLVLTIVGSLIFAAREFRMKTPEGGVIFALRLIDGKSCSSAMPAGVSPRRLLRSYGSLRRRFLARDHPLIGLRSPAGLIQGAGERAKVRLNRRRYGIQPALFPVPQVPLCERLAHHQCQLHGQDQQQD